MTQEKKVNPRDVALKWAKELYPIKTPEQQAEAEADFPELKKIEKFTEFEKAVKQVMEEAIECGDTHNLKADAEMLFNLAHKHVYEETSPTWEEHDELNRRIKDAFRHSLEEFFSDRYVLISKRKSGWRMPPPR